MQQQGNQRCEGGDATNWPMRELEETDGKHPALVYPGTKECGVEWSGPGECRLLDALARGGWGRGTAAPTLAVTMRERLELPAKPRGGERIHATASRQMGV